MRPPRRSLTALASILLAGMAAVAGADEAEPVRILYFEGEPRFEQKFIRRAAVDAEGEFPRGRAAEDRRESLFRGLLSIATQSSLMVSHRRSKS